MNQYQEDQIYARKIYQQYQGKDESKREKLKRLDKKVKKPGRVWAILLGIIGSLVMGGGMSLVMVWENLILGMALGLSGMVLIILAYPLNRLITNRRKKQYAPDIYKLSEEMLGVQG